MLCLSSMEIFLYFHCLISVLILQVQRTVLTGLAQVLHLCSAAGSLFCFPTPSHARKSGKAIQMQEAEWRQGNADC